MTLGADLVGGLGREVLALELAALLVDALLERPVERAQQRDPRALAAGDLVELLLHAGGELEVHVLAEVLDQEVRDDLADRLGVEAPLDDLDVAAVHDRRDRGGVRGRPADAVLLERLDQRRLGVARRRLREVLRRRHVLDGRAVALGQRRQPAGLLGLLGRVVLALGVDRGRTRRTASASPRRAGRSGRR